jgi:hypothetical protein
MEQSFERAVHDHVRDGACPRLEGEQPPLTGRVRCPLLVGFISIPGV